jgi:hypothetical protein
MFCRSLQLRVMAPRHLAIVGVAEQRDNSRVTFQSTTREHSIVVSPQVRQGVNIRPHQTYLADVFIFFSQNGLPRIPSLILSYKATNTRTMVR